MGLRENEINRRFEDLTLGFADLLFRVAYARTGNRQDAEDIVQETYLKAFRSFSSYRDGTSMKAWLTQILINTARDRHRHNAHAIATVELDEAMGDGADEQAFAGPEDDLCNHEIDAELAGALRSMSEPLAVPLILREAYDASYDEIARILGIPIGTVMSRLSRARSALRKRLLPPGNGDVTGKPSGGAQL